MARTALALAALASSAMPELQIAAARLYSYGEQGENDSAVLTLGSGTELLVRVPVTPESDSSLAMELIALAGLTPGVRSLLPFTVPNIIGGFAVTDAAIGPVRAVIAELMPGFKFHVRDLGGDTSLAADIARTLAAIHRIPASAILEAGLPVRSARELRDEANALLDRAAATRLVPATVLGRWQDRVDDAALWQFQSTVVHGTVSDDAFLVEDDRVTGVLSWSQLRVADPAADFTWLHGAAPGAMEAVVELYAEASRLAGAAGLRERAALYAELEVARWLLHGVTRRDQEIIDDAVHMLDTLVERIAADAPRPTAAPEWATEAVEPLSDEIVEAASATRPADDATAPVEPLPAQERAAAADDGDAPSTSAALPTEPYDPFPAAEDADAAEASHDDSTPDQRDSSSSSS